MAQSTKRSAANPYNTGGRSPYQVAPRRRAPRYSTGAETQDVPSTTYGVPATRQIAGEAGTSAEASYPRYQVPTGVEAGETETYGPSVNAPSAAPSQRISTPEMLTERQGMIANRALGPMRERGTLFGDLLGGLSTEKANPNFDPNAPIGGENVPYKGTSGLSGFFQRFGGNRANELNLGAQAEQASEWRDKALRDEERQAKREDLAYEINLRTDAEKDLKKDDRTFTASQAEAARDFQSAQNALDRALRLAEGTANREAAITEARARLTAARENLDRELTFRGQEGERERTFRGKEGRAERKLRREAIKPANFTRLGDNVFVDREGNVMEYTPGTPPYGKQKGTRGKLRKLGMPGSAPMPEEGDVDVDPTTGKPLGAAGQLPPGGGVLMGGTLPPSPQVTPMRAAAPSPEADASLLGRFRTAMPSLSFAQPSGRGYQVAPLTEGDVAQQAMEQIAYPLRAAAAQEAKSGFQNPEEAAYLLEEKPKWRFRRAGATEMSEARKAGDVIRQMYAE